MTSLRDRRRHVDPAKLEEARELILAGESKRSSARMTGLKAVYVITMTSDLTTGLRGRPLWERNYEMFKRFCSGWSHDELAVEYGISKALVTRVLCNCRRELLKDAGADLADVRCDGRSKLSPNQVRAIRADERPVREISEEYGLHRSTIQFIKERKTYKDVD